MLIAACVPATVKLISDTSSCSGVGLIINLPSTLPTTTPAIGPSNGISEIINAIDEPNIAAIAVEQSGSFDKTVLITCTSLLNPSANKGRIGRSINLETKVSCVVAFPSRFKNPPGILPAAYCFSWYKTINGKKSWVDATLLETAADNTTLSPYLTKHAPDACLATSPISITSGRPAQLYSKRLISLIFYFSP